MRIAIVEDEDSAAGSLEEYIKKYSEKFGVSTETDRFVDPLLLLGKYKPVYDIIFMDIIMPHMNGMEAAEKLRKIDKDVVLIFVTNMQNYAIRGYEVNALDFIVKPVSYNLFEFKMHRAVKAVSEKKNERSISVVCGGVTKVLAVSKIFYVEVKGHTVTYHTSDGEYSVRGTLDRAEAELPKDSFARCNYCYLVNLGYVKSVDSSLVYLQDFSLAVSRNKKKEFLGALADYLGKNV